MGTLETLTLLSMSGAGISGRVMTPVSTVKMRCADSSHTAAFDSMSRNSASFFADPACQVWERCSIAPSALDSNKENVSRSSSYRFSATGHRSLRTRQSYEGNEARCPVDDRHSSGLLSHGNARARRVPRVSTSPVLDTESKRIFYPSQVPSVGIPVEEEISDWDLPPDLQPELMPRHVAIIMDGNSRWARDRGLHMSVGHAAGAEALKRVARAASNWGIDALTVFAFSTENWRRSQMEVDFLMNLFATKIQAELATLIRCNLQLRFVGDMSALPLSVQEAVELAKQCTSMNTGMIINICLNYSGRADLVRACKRLATQVAEGSLSPSNIDDAAIASELLMSELGNLQDPDLVIRTSGEYRISNFLLWQVAYSEFFFSDTLWPDFGKEDFKTALLTYQSRDRRYGRRHDYGQSGEQMMEVTG